jgi:hypothetical protein
LESQIQLPCFQQPSSAPYHEPDECSPHICFAYCKIYSNMFISSTPKFCPVPEVPLLKFMCISHIRSACYVCFHFIVIYFTTLLISDGKCNLCNELLYNTLHFSSCFLRLGLYLFVHPVRKYPHCVRDVMI